MADRDTLARYANARVQELEGEIHALQKQVKRLEARLFQTQIAIPVILIIWTALIL